MPSDHVLPFYVLCDESFSMLDHIDALNDSLLELRQALGADPVLAERTQLCLIGFSESPEILLPLCRLSEITAISGLITRAATNFGAAFTFLRETITRDMPLLEARHHRVDRPTVFFLSDGQATDPATWPTAFAALTDQSWAARPNMIAVGIGDADPATIGRIGTFGAFVGQDRVHPGPELQGFARVLLASIMRCVDAPRAAHTGLVHSWSMGGVQADAGSGGASD